MRENLYVVFVLFISLSGYVIRLVPVNYQSQNIQGAPLAQFVKSNIANQKSLGKNNKISTTKQPPCTNKKLKKSANLIKDEPLFNLISQPENLAANQKKKFSKKYNSDNQIQRNVLISRSSRVQPHATKIILKNIKKTTSFINRIKADRIIPQVKLDNQKSTIPSSPYSLQQNIIKKVGNFDTLKKPEEKKFHIFLTKQVPLIQKDTFSVSDVHTTKQSILTIYNQSTVTITKSYTGPPKKPSLGKTHSVRSVVEIIKTVYLPSPYKKNNKNTEKAILTPVSFPQKPISDINNKKSIKDTKMTSLVSHAQNPSDNSDENTNTKIEESIDQVIESVNDKDIVEEGLVSITKNKIDKSASYVQSSVSKIESVSTQGIGTKSQNLLDETDNKDLIEFKESSKVPGNSDRKLEKTTTNIFKSKITDKASTILSDNKATRVVANDSNISSVSKISDNYNTKYLSELQKLNTNVEKISNLMKKGLDLKLSGMKFCTNENKNSWSKFKIEEDNTTGNQVQNIKKSFIELSDADEDPLDSADRINSKYNSKLITKYLIEDKQKHEMLYKDSDKDEIVKLISSDSNDEDLQNYINMHHSWHVYSSNKHDSPDFYSGIKILKMSELLQGSNEDPCTFMFRRRIHQSLAGNFAYCSLLESSPYKDKGSVVYLSDII